MAHNMNITIDPEVQAFLIKKKKKCLVLDISTSGGGCCPTFEVADISYTKPDDLINYKNTIVDDIEIYVSIKAIVSAPVLRFSQEKVGLMKQIVVKGLHLKGDR